MSREEHDPEDRRTTRSSRRNTQPTDRLTPGGASYGEPINPNWRGERATGRNRRAQEIPSSRQEFVLWLQDGGWRILAIVGLVAILAIFALIFLSGTRKPLPRLTPTAAPLIGESGRPEQPSVTPPVSPTAQLGSQGGAQFRVFNTGTEGLLLRPDPNTNNQPIKTLPEGTIVTIIGDDSVGPDRIWKHVRDPDGAEGWVASDWLQPVR